MDQLIEWVRANSKEGANLAEFENLLEADNPMMKIQSKEEALAFIEKTPYFKSALDSETSKRIENALNRFQEEKIPGLWKEREEELRKELSPEETPEQKRIRELEERIAAADKREQEEGLKSDLRAKAKEIGFDPLRAERYAVYGDNAAKFMQEDFESNKKAIETQIDKEIKSRYKGETPKGEKPNDPDKVMSRQQFDQLSPSARMEFMKSGGVTTDEN